MKMKTIPVLLLSGILLFTGCGASKKHRVNCVFVSSSCGGFLNRCIFTGGFFIVCSVGQFRSFIFRDSFRYNRDLCCRFPAGLFRDSTSRRRSAATASGYGEGTNVTPGGISRQLQMPRSRKPAQSARLHPLKEIMKSRSIPLSSRPTAQTAWQLTRS